MITMIPCSKLEPHPDNPRKELGDLSELTASIRKQGLLQNLTVVPSPDSPDKYRIVIGHRRFSASGIAGLDELPCIIDTKMTYPEQIAVMMSENIQRNDLIVPAAFPLGFTPTLHRYRLDDPQQWKQPRNIFVCSMADLFGDWVPDEWIVQY